MYIDHKLDFCLVCVWCGTGGGWSNGLLGAVGQTNW